MRPKLLVISGWGPYRDVQTVDFSSFERGGLFLITGPTGAGKTTVFDTITFALYGQVSGTVRDTGQVRSDFAAEETKTWVEFTFSHRDEIYRVRRNPSYPRKKKKGDGYTTEREQAVLFLPDGTSLEGNAPVNEKLREILSIDLIQFRQLSMIAQGEFTRLLTARADERRTIFRNIFQLGRFDRMRQAMQKREREERQRLQALRDSLREEIVRAAEEEEALKERIHGDGVDWEEALACLRESIAQQEALLRLGIKESTRLTEAVKNQSAELERKRQKNARLQELYKARKELDRLLVQKEEIEEVKRRVETGVRAGRLSGAYTSLQEIRGRLRQLGMEQKRETDKKDRLEQLQKELAPVCEDIKAREERELEREEEIRKLSGVLKELDTLSMEETQLQDMQKTYERLEAQYQESRRRTDALEQKYRRSAVGLAARYLQEGMPCPVCGSLTHPKKAQISDEVPDEKTLEKARKQTKALLDQWNESTAETAAQAGKVGEIKRKTGEILLTLSAKTDTSCWDRDSLAGYLKDQQRKAEAYKKEAERLREEYEKTDKELLTVRAVCSRIDRDLQEAARICGQKEEAFGISCREAGFADEQEYQSGCMEEALLVRERKRIEAYEQKLAFLERETARLHRETKDTVLEDLTAEEEKLFALEEKIEKSQQQQLKLHAGIESRKNSLTRLKEGRKKQELLEQSYGVTSDIFRAVSGNNRQNMIFEDYVIAGYFDQILLAANYRLLRMSSGRYELSRIRQASDARSRDSLELQVLDHYTGKYRAVKTLSGGESFKAALSMALGMADIIQRNAGGIELETLFIDEGFGSLDRESLDQAVDTLSALAGTDRMVGIISHVGELKERIGHQILIEKHADGSRIQMGG